MPESEKEDDYWIFMALGILLLLAMSLNMGPADDSFEMKCPVIQGP